jgi:hypothetical protein
LDGTPQNDHPDTVRDSRDRRSDKGQYSAYQKRRAPSSPVGEWTEKQLTDGKHYGKRHNGKLDCPRRPVENLAQDRHCRNDQTRRHFPERSTKHQRRKN